MNKIKLNSSTLFAFSMGCIVGAFLYPTLNGVWEASSSENPHINVCFSPEGHCTNGIVSVIDQAKSSIYVMAYSFTSLQIAHALVKAYERGVDVQILVDKSQVHHKRSPLSVLAKVGIPVLVDSVKGIAHNKTMIFDERYVLTGSFNWSQAADSRNAENILLIDDPSLAKIYRENWEKRAISGKKVSF